MQSIDSPYEWADACNGSGDAAAADPGCSARTSYEHLDSGWVKSQSEPKVVDPDTQAEIPFAISYGYDRRGYQTRWATKPGSEERRIVTRAFYPNGTLEQRTAQERGSDPSPQRTYTYKYNENRSMTEMTHPAPAGGGTQRSPTKVEYDDAERAIRIDESYTTAQKGDTEYAYDRDGNVMDRRADGTGGTSGDTMSFRYDAMGRETQALACSNFVRPATPTAAARIRARRRPVTGTRRRSVPASARTTWSSRATSPTTATSSG